MARIPVLTTLLLQLFCTLTTVLGQSPCPEYFTYLINPSTNEIYGQITIPSPPRSSELHIKVAMSIAAHLPTDYVGQVRLAQSDDDTVRAIQEGRPVLYHLHFPLKRPTTLVTGIWINDQQYCRGPNAKGQAVTSIELEHTLFAPQGAIPLSNSRPQHSSSGTRPTTRRPSNPYEGNIFLNVFATYSPVRTDPPMRTNPPVRTKPPVRTTKPPVRTDPPMRINVPVNTESPVSFDNDCGVISNANNDVNQLISKGVTISPGQWPWLVAMFVIQIDFEFQCAGSILTNRHVITAAHCFKIDKDHNINIPPSAMLASLGRYRLRDWYETGSVNREIASYVLHPDYRHQKSGDSDLAIFTLRNPVEFSPTIKPICLWSGSSDLGDVINIAGFVVGWGRDEFGNPYLAEPRMARAPIVSHSDCHWSDERFVTFTSNRTICAGLRDGSGPCNGDSGSGLMVFNTTTGRYHLRGIVSRSLYNRGEETCDLSQYVVFVDVTKYKEWIQQQISTG